MKKVIVVCKALVLVGFLLNSTMSNRSSVQGREKPNVNCIGSLTDVYGYTYPRIENLTIAGLYKQIRVYPKPLRAVKDPTHNRAFLDPIKLSSIKVLGPVEYNKRSYVDLEVTRKDGVKEQFIIESNRIVGYDIPTGVGFENREISIDAVDTISFDSCVKQAQDDECLPAPVKDKKEINTHSVPTDVQKE